MPRNCALEEMIPQSLGRYQIIAELGRGAMGTVYHGLDLTIERPVALKTLNPELPEEILDEVKGRFLREAKSAGRLNHPNIVTIYEFGESQGTAFIAMEYLEGKSLHQVMKGARLPFATIAEIVAQIADGLDYAHRFGVVHRDIKPANIMISPHGIAKLTDFGIAHVQSSTMTNAGTMLGSPKYMAPEHVLGKQIDGRADIFSLGIVLYELLSQRTPFETEDPTIFSMMQRIVTMAQRPLSEIAPHAPPAFDLILTRALAKRPEDRYQRANQFANDLRNFKSLMHANGTPDMDRTAIINRPAYAEAGPPTAAAAGLAPNSVPNTKPNTPPTAATMPPTPAQSMPAAADSPTLPTSPMAAAPSATPPVAPPVPTEGLTAWERAAAFLGRKAPSRIQITPPTATMASPQPAMQTPPPAPPRPITPPAVSPPPMQTPPVAAMPAPPAPVLEQTWHTAPKPPVQPAPFAAAAPAASMSTQTSPLAPRSSAESAAAAIAAAGLEPPSRFAATRQKSDNPDHNLIGDLDALSDTLDQAQRQFLEEEATAMAALRKGAPRAKDWDAVLTGIHEPMQDGAPGAPGAGAGGAGRNSGVFGLLRQQASPSLKNQATARRDAEAEAMLQLDAKVRAGYHFLLEFCRELNDATPIYAGKHDLLFYGPCPPLLISDATVNARMNRIDDRGKVKDVVDHLLVSYHLLSPDPGRATVTATELPGFKAVLDRHEMKYDFQETKNDFKQVLRATFKFEFKFICSFTLKVNYPEANVEITCRNVGPLGRTRYVVAAADLEMSFFEELSKLILGFPSEAGRYLAEA